MLEGEVQTHEAGTDGRPTPRGGGGRAKCHRAEPGSLQDARQGKTLSNHRLAQAQMALAGLLTANLARSGLGWLTTGQPPTSYSFAKFSAVPSTQRTPRFVSISGSPGDRQERSKTCLEAMCPRVTLSLPR